MAKILLLFDIDGTLIRSTKITGNRYYVAISQVFHTAAKRSIPMSGKTDMGILLEMADAMGLDRKIVKRHLPKLYLLTIKYVKSVISNAKITPKDGARQLLTKLQKDGYVLGLVTGNLRQIAKLKLDAVGLYKFFKLGGFGDVSEDRSVLIKTAIREAKRRFDITGGRIFYFGDAPLDIRAGKKARIITIGVATGYYSQKDLKKEKPDYVIKDLSNVQKVLSILKKDGQRYE